MPVKKIVTGQQVPAQRLEFARQMRREMTPAEAKLWQRLKAGRLAGYHFRRQQVIGQYIVDFYCHQAGLVIEIDGGIHLQQVDYDRARENYLREIGLQVIRFDNEEVRHNLENVLAEILAACNKPG